MIRDYGGEKDKVPDRDTDIQEYCRGRVSLHRQDGICARSGGELHVFLSRPRRFGKSLLSSTIHSYFAGEAELFKGLKAGELKKEWTRHPVFHFDMSTAKHLDEDALRQIDEKGYLIPYRFEGADSEEDASASSATGRVLVKVGVNISTQTRTIESWKITPES